MNTNISSLLEKKWFLPTVVGVCSFGGGAAVGYILGKRNGDVFVVPAEVVEDVKKDPNQMDLFDIETNDSFADEGEAIRESHNHLTLVVEEEPETEDEEPAPAYNVFTNDDDWNYELELSQRNAREPYVISVEEFMNDETGYRQETVTYYVGDDILADEQDTPIYNWHNLMGDLKFGHGSKDKNLVYIRNEALHMEWEVIRHSGHFAIEVLGNSIEHEYAERELKHSHSPRKFRDD